MSEGQAHEAHLTLEAPYKDADPLNMDEARSAARRMAELRRAAEAEYRLAITDASEREMEYRKALAKEIVRLRNEGVGATEAGERARGADDVAEARRQRDISAGMVRAQLERLTGVEGERSMLTRLIDYSARMNYALREG